MGKLREIDPGLDRAAIAVAEQVAESSTDAIDQINRAIQVVGMEKVCELVTKANEAFLSDDPPMIMDGSRQRTLGGCFFQFLKESVNTATRHKIFPWTWPEDRR